jgi:asparagine synthetase B (glutamine-hydrolysing)
MVDKNYCMSSFLTYRYIFDNNMIFKEGIERAYYPLPEIKYMIHSADDIDTAIQEVLSSVVDKQTGIMLSGGMDSAILSSYLPAGIKAYTLESQADGAKKETKEARYFAEICKLEHCVVKITWEDYKAYTPICMKLKGAPVHSIEPMIYKAAIQAKADGCTKLIFGQTADIKFGGHDSLLSRDWTLDEFKNRYTFVDPAKILKHPVDVSKPFDSFMKNECYDVHSFYNELMVTPSCSSYFNACKVAGIECIMPYAFMKLDAPLDLQRIRSGESKYLIRELFAKRYPNSIPAVKLPMPRGVGIWLKDWDGPSRDEFLPNCVNGLDGDQRWYVYVLEWFLNLIEKK